jgi:membrane protease YdiL (CAAX protease family)
MIETAEAAGPAHGQFSLTTRTCLVAGVIVLWLCRAIALFGGDDAPTYWVSIALEIITGFILPIFLWNWRDELGLDLGPGVPASRFMTILMALPVMIALRLAMWPPGYLLFDLLHLPEPDLSMYHLEPGNVRTLISFLIGGGISAPVVEELVFRGFVLNELRRLLAGHIRGKLWALLLSSLLFGFIHGPIQGIGGIVMTCLMGLGFGTIFMQSRNNLWLVMCVHGFSNVTSALANFYDL